MRADSGIADASGLGGKVVGAGAGTPSIKMLQMSADEHGHAFDGDIKTYDDDAVAYEAMRAGRVEAYASSIVSLMEYAKTTEGMYAVVPFTSKHWGQEFTCMASQGGRGSARSVQQPHRGDEGRRHPRGAPEQVVRAVLRDLLPNVPPEW